MSVNNLHWWALSELLNQTQLSKFDCEEAISICAQLKDGEVPLPLRSHLTQQGMIRLVELLETSFKSMLVEATKVPTEDPLDLIGDNL